ALSNGIAANSQGIASNAAGIAQNAGDIADNRVAINKNAGDINLLNRGGAGPVQYSNPDNPTVPNGGKPTNDLTLVGADSTKPVTLHNVAPGRANTDAVNVAQLKGVAGNLYNALDDVSKEGKAGVAGSSAIAMLGHARNSGESAVSAGVAFHEGEAALAVGVSAWSDNGRWLLKGALSQDTQSQTTVGASATYSW
ncbi:MAG: hypothetical protein CR975_03890, partial [Gammaproteobacteria bacterium]